MRSPLLWLMVLITPLCWAEDAISLKSCDSKYSAKLVSLQGSLFLDAGSNGQWQPAGLDQQICEGSRVRTEAYSRASIALPNGIVLRLDQNTVLSLNGFAPQKKTLMDLAKGFVHFISRTPTQLQITTPIANAGPEGTEFALRVDDQQAALWVYEGAVKFFNAKGDVRLKPGESALAQAGQAPRSQIDLRPQDAVNWALYYPPILPYPDAASAVDSQIRAAIEQFRHGHVDIALASLDNLAAEKHTAYFYKIRAAMRLTVGQVDLARQDIQALLTIKANDAEAFALQAIIALTQNRKDEALLLVQRAISADPQSATAYSALSYTEQARFNLEKAQAAADQAAKLAPHDAMVWARKAELELSQGATSDSKQAAQRALSLDPNLERTQTIAGFAHLLRMDTGDALQAFNKAIALDSSSPLARLGLGLAKIRNGDLTEGRQDLEIAAILDPNNSLIRSYLGKAYYEEKRNPLAEDQFGLAKLRDPKDPTPWFYDAIEKQTTNRPVEALEDLQTAIELNENRAVYRSKQALDADLAARSAALGRIYNDLGFGQRALTEGWKSVNNDPTDYSGHRLLADNFASLPRHELARTSELLQSQILQPINITPIQPQLAERNLAIAPGSGPATTGYNEFNPLFAKDGFSFQASSVVGSLGTYGDEVVHSGLWKNYSYSLGQFHHESSGFRPNNQINQNIYNAFVQVNLTQNLSVEAEYRHRDLSHGDLFFYGNLDFNISQYNRQINIPDFVRHVTTDNLRLSSRLSLSPKNTLIGSLYFIDHLDISNNYAIINADKKYQRGLVGEIQYHYKTEPYKMVLGASGYEMTNENSRTPAPLSEKQFNTQYGSIYSYSYVNYPKNGTLIFGLSFESLQNTLNGSQDYNQFNPKLGIQWEITKDTTVRAAAFRTLSRGIWVDATIEPTQIAGFNQLFDSYPATDARRYGIGIDHKINHSILMGIEISKRDLVQPVIDYGDFSIINDNWEEHLLRSYWYWEINNFLASSVEYQYEMVSQNKVSQYKNHFVPMSLRFFDKSSSFSASATLTYVNQNAIMPAFNTDINSDFELLDVALKYRFPARHGFIMLTAKNLFDKKFDFVGQSLAGARNNRFEESPPFFPERTFFVNLTFAF